MGVYHENINEIVIREANVRNCWEFTYKLTGLNQFQFCENGYTRAQIVNKSNIVETFECFRETFIEF